MGNKIYLKSEYDKFWSKILRGENFAFMRYGDGERAIMDGTSVTAQEGWVSPSYVSKLGVDSKDAMMLTDSNGCDMVWYGMVFHAHVVTLLLIIGICHIFIVITSHLQIYG